MEVSRESDQRPAEWQWVTLVEQRKGRFMVCLPVTGSPIDRGILAAMKLDLKTKTSGLTLKAAIELGWLVEEWRSFQEKRAKPEGKQRKGRV